MNHIFVLRSLNPLLWDHAKEYVDVMWQVSAVLLCWRGKQEEKGFWVCSVVTWPFLVGTLKCDCHVWDFAPVMATIIVLGKKCVSPNPKGKLTFLYNPPPLQFGERYKNENRRHNWWFMGKRISSQHTQFWNSVLCARSPFTKKAFRFVPASKEFESLAVNFSLAIRLWTTCRYCAHMWEQAVEAEAAEKCFGALPRTYLTQWKVWNTFLLQFRILLLQLNITGASWERKSVLLW